MLSHSGRYGNKQTIVASKPMIRTWSRAPPATETTVLSLNVNTALTKDIGQMVDSAVECPGFESRYL